MHEQRFLNPIPSPLWQMHSFQSGDETELVQLFEQVFNKPICEEHWRWKLKSLPSPVENVWLASVDERIVFQSAGIPLPYSLPNGVQTGMVLVDTMTAMEFRRQGLLTTIVGSAYANWEENGIPFVIALPNEQWGSRIGALGWKDLFRLQWLRYPLQPERLLASRLRLPLASQLSLFGELWRTVQLRKVQSDPAIRVHPVLEADASFDDLWQRCSQQLGLSIVRDQDWVNWRFLAAPMFNYKVIAATRAGLNLGYLAYRIVSEAARNVGLIAEIFTDPADMRTFHTLLYHAIDQFNEAGVDTIATLAVPGNWLFSALHQAGFFPGRRSFPVKYVPLATDIPIQTLREPSNWYMSGADYDVI